MENKSCHDSAFVSAACQKKMMTNLSEWMSGSIWMKDDRLHSWLRVKCINSVIVKFAVIYFDLISLHIKIIQSIANIRYTLRTFRFFLLLSPSINIKMCVQNRTLSSTKMLSVWQKKMCLIFMLNHYSKLWKDPHASYTLYYIRSIPKKWKKKTER